MGFTTPGIQGYWRVIVTRIGCMMLMRLRPQVVMFLRTLGGGVISWKSYKQTILTRSRMEAELTALDTATVVAEWLRELLMDLPMVEK